MNREKEIIKLICQSVERSDLQQNKLFESDSEILTYKGGRLLVNIDEFSMEDMLRENDPFTLGWNIAVGAISDILASGGNPLFYVHSLVVNKTWSDEFIRLFSEGIASCLKEASVVFAGGDLGESEVWRCTATVIGELHSEPLLRSGAKIGDSIYITGKVGVGNLEACLKMYSDSKLISRFANRIKNRFRLRINEAELIRKYSSCCTDTSDGVFNSLNNISQMSNTGFEISGVPYIKSGLLASKLFSLPKTLLFLGECGEYELLFTVGKNAENDFLEEAKERNMTFYKIGEVSRPEIKILQEDGRTFDLRTLSLSARGYADIKDYIKELINFIKQPSTAIKSRNYIF